jgi:hypothetical protein
MKLKMRLLAPLFAVLMLGTATSAFADLSCAVTIPTPAARTIVNGHWENTGDINFNCTATNATPTTDTSITIYFSGYTITNSPTVPGGLNEHRIEIAPGGMAGVSLDTTRPDPGFGNSGVNNAGSQVALLILGSGAAAPTGGTFTLRNVLLSLAGAATVGNPININVNAVSQTGNTVLTFPTTPLTIISNVLPMLNNTTNPPVLGAAVVGEVAGPAQFTPTGGIPPASIACSTVNCRNNKAAFSLTLTEDHIDSWRNSAQTYNNGIGVGINGTNVLYTFSGMLPGSIISNCVLVQPAGTTWTLTGSGIAGSAGTTTLVAELVGGATNLTALESLTINCGTSTANPAYLPGVSTGNATTNINVSMSTFPNGVALPGMIPAPATTGGTPRYAATGGSVGPVTVVTFGASATGQTMMIIPYALANVSCGTNCTYDTGIAIANTTKDAVFGTDTQGAAPDTSGNITFNFYPADGSASFSVTPTTGFNLVSGAIPSGNSFIGTLSSILRVNNITAPFQGYIIAQVNFSHAHATAYVYGGSAADRLTSATDVLVIANPLVYGRALGGAPPATVLFEDTGK